MLWIAILALAGASLSSISLYHHFGTAKTGFCDFGHSFNCDLVNRSAYSTVAGVPVALIGMVGYLAILAFATVYRDKAETPLILALACVGGLGFSLYLTYIEAHVLGVWCVLCLSSLALIFTLALLSVSLVLTALRGS
jgi:uncharacterized membrane protein